MRIIQSTWGTFHHFDLARELERRGHLLKIYSTNPWARLKREGLPHSKVETFPWFQMPQILVKRCFSGFPGFSAVDSVLEYAVTPTFEEWLDLRIPKSGVDAWIALSGAGLKVGPRLQDNGGLYICDRGSTHQLYQQRVLHEELQRWGIDQPTPRLRSELYRREILTYDIADAITVPSSFAARSFVECGIAKEKVHVIPYGVRLEKFYPMCEPAAGTFEVLFVGQVGARKGVPYLLEAFAALKHPRKRLRIVGAIQPGFEPVIARLPKDQVEFLGIRPQAEVARSMSSSHVMVLPSIEEGLALVQGQALACGCPVVATPNTGSEDLYTDGVEGFIVPARDPNAIRERLQQLADDDNLRQRMSEAALQRVQHLGGWSHYGDLWVDLLERLLAARL